MGKDDVLFKSETEDEQIVRKSYIKGTKNRCPQCRSTRIEFRKKFNNILCRRCGTVFDENKIIILRKRMACPICRSVSAVIYRISTDDYYCSRCKQKVVKVENFKIKPRRAWWLRQKWYGDDQK